MVTVLDSAGLDGGSQFKRRGEAEDRSIILKQGILVALHIKHSQHLRTKGRLKT